MGKNCLHASAWSAIDGVAEPGSRLRAWFYLHCASGALVIQSSAAALAYGDVLRMDAEVQQNGGQRTSKNGNSRDTNVQFNLWRT